MTRRKGSKDKKKRKAWTSKAPGEGTLNAVEPVAPTDVPDAVVDSAEAGNGTATSSLESPCPEPGASDDLLGKVVADQQAQKHRPVGRTPKDKDFSEEKKLRDVRDDPELVELTAEASADAEIAILSALFGKTFEPDYKDRDDRKMLVLGYRYWFKAYGIPFPPWGLFLLTQIAYVAFRLGDSYNRARIKAAIDKLTSKPRIINADTPRAPSGPVPVPEGSPLFAGPAPAVQPAPSTSTAIPAVTGLIPVTAETAPIPARDPALGKKPNSGSKLADGRDVGGTQPF